MIRPRALVFRGRVLACGVWLDRELLGEAEARRRVRALWTSGCTLWEVAGGWVVRWPGERIVGVPGPGRPLVAHQGGLVGCPLSEAEGEAWNPASGGIALPEAGVLVEHRPVGPIDPASWVDLEGLELVLGRGLGPVDVASTDVVDAVEDPVAEFGGGTRIRLAKLLAAQSVSAEQAEPRPMEASLPWWARWLAQALSAVDRSLERMQPPPPPRPLQPGIPRAPRPESWIDRLRRQLSGWMLRLAARGPLSWLARKEAEWLEALLAAFDRGDLEEALRRAIPLGAEGDEGEEPGWFNPKLREGELAPTPRRRGSGASMLLSGPSLHQTLQRLYREAAERLESEGRITEAAFVYADLLEEPAVAVELLERHDRHADAAALAEGRGLDPTWAARLWVEADDLERAVQLARRHDAWADLLAAVAQHAAWAEGGVRLAWAQTRVASGDVLGGIRTAWEARELREQALSWLDEALEAPGRDGAEALGIAWRLRDPGPLLPRAAQILDARGSLGDVHRAALMRGLDPRSSIISEDARGEEASLLDARLITRLVRASLSLPARVVDPRLRARLVADGVDTALRLDLPKDELPSPSPWRDVPASDRGQHAVHDAAWLPDGRIAVALGESGVQLLEPDGKVVARLPIPASGLVPSDMGRHLLTTMVRDGVVVVHRVDLHTGRAEPWSRARLVSWARSFDGERWCVSTGNDLLVLDALDPGWKHLWRTPVGGELRQLVRTPQGLRGLVRVGSELELWRWELPSVTLRARVPTGAHPDEPVRFLGEPAAVVNGGVRVVGLHPTPVLPQLDGQRVLDGDLGGKVRVILLADEEGVWVTTIPNSPQTVWGAGQAAGAWRPPGSFRLEGATRAGLRPVGDAWLVYDDLGRVRHVGGDEACTVDVRVGFR